MDQSLDEIISRRPRSGRRGSSRRGGGAARSEVLGKQPVNPSTRARYAGATPAANGAKTTNAQPADKIIVSNLPIDVNEAQVKELFTSTVGPLREVTLHYDAHGRSKGVAAVHFSRRGDGTKAYNQYNNRLIDGKKPMKIEIVFDPTKAAPAASLASRVAPAAGAAAEAKGTRGGKAGRGGRGGGRKKSEKTPKTAADLDAEMEDYTANNAPAAAA